MRRPEFERISVLIVDDNRYMRHIVKSIMCAFGSRRIAEATDGADAFKVMHSLAPDIVITNWNMSPLDGLDFVRLVRTARDSPNRYIPIVMLSGHTETHRVAQARDAGINEFVAKPVAARTLYEKLQAVVVRPRPFIRAPHYFGPDRRRHFRRERDGAERRRQAPTVVKVSPMDGLAPPLGVLTKTQVKNLMRIDRVMAVGSDGRDQVRGAGRTIR